MGSAWEAQVEAWLAGDPDPDSRAELRALLAGLPETGADLATRFAGPLRFGTAGLRGPLRAGPQGMNPAVVRTATAGLVSWLGATGPPGPVVIGYDARHGSARFAEEAARVVTGAGRAALLLPRPLPTPVLAATVRPYRAAAGVMITASHNPAGDNGYKVYLGDGAPLPPGVEADVEAAIRGAGPAAAVPRGGPGTELGDEMVTSYLDRAARLVAPGGTRDLTVAYTPLHGVGAPVVTAVLARAGFPPPAVVPEQAAPDPDFPTAPYPNPEDPATLTRLLALAADSGADLAVATDPDADRCAVAVPGPDGWRVLTGDELGVLLADHLLRRGVPGPYVTTVVSSAQLRDLCAARGAPYRETATGFKWIVRELGDRGYGYEEALGYCAAPDLVRDKDGITATLLACELAAALRAEGRDLAGRLDALAAELGAVYVTGQVAVRLSPDAADAVLARLAAPPERLLGAPATAATGPPGVVTIRADRATLVIRRSGTEPKLKAYLEVVEPCAATGVPGARTRAATRLHSLLRRSRDYLDELISNHPNSP